MFRGWPVDERIEEKTPRRWPDAVHELAGAWKDFPEAEDIRRFAGRDAERQPL